MLELSHSLIGASIAGLIPNPYLGLPLCLISHVLADIFPHWDFQTRSTPRSKQQLITLSLLDAFIGIALSFMVFRSYIPTWYLLASIFVAQLPDWLESPYHVFTWRFSPFIDIKKFQSRFHNKLNLPWGLVGQLLFVLLITSLSLYILRF